MSRKSWIPVVTSMPIFAPRRSMTALVTSVVPCAIRSREPHRVLDRKAANIRNGEFLVEKTLHCLCGRHLAVGSQETRNDGPCPFQ